jgi:hypothetical protein
VAVPTRTQPRLGRAVEAGHRLDQGQPGAHRPLGVVLVGPRVAEISEHTVANIFGDKSAGGFNDGGNAAVIGADHRTQILRVEPRRQCRRADQIAEQHRQLPALGVAIPFSSLRRGPIGSPSAARSDSVRSGRTSRSISCSRNAGSYRSSPKLSSHAAIAKRPSPSPSGCSRSICH